MYAAKICSSKILTQAGMYHGHKTVLYAVHVLTFQNLHDNECTFHVHVVTVLLL